MFDFDCPAPRIPYPTYAPDVSEVADEAGSDVADRIIAALQHLRGAELAGDSLKINSALQDLWDQIAERDGEHWYEAPSADLVLHAMKSTHPWMWRPDIARLEALGAPVEAREAA